MLYCTVLYCTVLCCTVLFCAVLYCTVLYCTVLYCTVLYCTVLYCTVIYYAVLYRPDILRSAVLYCTVLSCCTDILYSTAVLVYWISPASVPAIVDLGSAFTIANWSAGKAAGLDPNGPHVQYNGQVTLLTWL